MRGDTSGVLGLLRAGFAILATVCALPFIGGTQVCVWIFAHKERDAVAKITGRVHVSNRDADLEIETLPHKFSTENIVDFLIPNANYTAEYVNLDNNVVHSLESRQSATHISITRTDHGKYHIFYADIKDEKDLRALNVGNINKLKI